MESPVKFLIPMAMLLLATPAFAQHPANHEAKEDSVVTVIDRMEIHRSTFHIVNRKQEAALVLRPKGTIVLQLTDAGLKQVKKEIKSEGDGLLSKMMHSALAGAVSQFLDHGLEYQLSDLKEARVEKGVLVFERKNGERVFDSIEINDEEILATFAPAEAQRFAARVNEAIRTRK
jgi:hypothetical protein